MEEPKLENKVEDISVAKDAAKIIIESLSTNWTLTQDNKKLDDAFATIAASKAPARLGLEEIVTDDSCVILQPANANSEDEHEACMVNVNLTEGHKISRIAIVSEASVLEFFKEWGEYADTKFAELIDEFEDATVYLVDLTFEKPISQAGIKFTRIHNSRSNFYLYGVKLVIAEAKSLPRDRHIFEDILKSSYGKNIATGAKLPIGFPNFTNMPDYDGNFTTEMNACLQSFMGKALSREKPKKEIKVTTGESKEESDAATARAKQSSIELYIDQKFRELETRLVQKIDEAEARNTQKLEAILKILETRSSS